MRRKIIAILLASGKGTRLDCNVPKQYLLVNNKPLFSYSFETFYNNEKITDILIVKNPEYDFDFSSWTTQTKKYKKIYLVNGSLLSRNDSLANAIKFINDNLNIDNEDIILTHDVARPLITTKIIDTNIEKILENNKTVISTCISSVDSVGVSEKGMLKNILKRNDVILEQTPQSACFEILKEIYLDKYDEFKRYFSITNDFCELALIANKKVNIVDGHKLNFKITDKIDLDFFRSIKNN